MPATKLRCSFCRKKFWASRSDTLYCSEKCRGRSRYEDGKFKYPQIPKSGVVGITFKRFGGVWEVKIQESDGLKYVGTRKTREEAIQFQKEVMG